MSRATHNWDYYDPGREIGRAVVVARLRETELQQSTIYAVIFDCCRQRKEISHYHLRRRELRNSTHCIDCARRVSGERVAARKKAEAAARRRARLRRLHGDAGVLWPVPSWVPLGVHVMWEDRMG